MKNILFIFFSILNINCSAPKNNDLENADTYEVNFHQVICYGEGAQWCMQVKSKNDKDWTFHYDQIEGFKYEWGYKYTVSVDKIKIKNPPQDASSEKWVLKSVLKKEKKAENTTFVLDIPADLIQYDKSQNNMTVLGKVFPLKKGLILGKLMATQKVKFQIFSGVIEVVEML